MGVLLTFLPVGAMIMIYGVTLTTSTIAFLAIVFGIILDIKRNQSQMLYQTSINGLPGSLPNEHYPSGYRYPSDLQLQFEEVELVTDDREKLRGWFIPAHRLMNTDGWEGGLPEVIPIKQQVQNDDSKTTSKHDDTDEDIEDVMTDKVRAKITASIATGNIPTILFFHANAGSVNLRIPNIYMNVLTLGANVMIFDYRGYGLSTGTPSEDGLILDSKAVIEYLLQRKDINTEYIYYFGRSLGGAVAIAAAKELAHIYTPRGLILENTFTSISNLVDTMFPILKNVKQLLLELDWNSIGRLESIHVPVLIIRGDQDEIVPTSHSITLYEACQSEIKCLLTIQGGKHTSCWSDSSYCNYYRQFLQYTCNNKTYDSSKIDASSDKQIYTTTDNNMKHIYEEYDDKMNRTTMIVRHLLGQLGYY